MYSGTICTQETKDCAQFNRDLVFFITGLYRLRFL